VIFITFGGSTIPNQFSQAFEALTAALDRRRVAFNSP
jgi:hypothetical protein